MTDPFIQRLAARIARTERRLDGVTRTPQLPASSIDTPDGETQAIADAVTKATDTAADLVQVADQMLDVDDLGDDTAFQAGAVTPQVEGAAGDPGFDLAVFTASRVKEAQATADDAAEAALEAKTTADGKNRIIPSPTEPVADPDLPFAQGDLWYETIVVSGQNRFIGVHIWNGTEWRPYQIVADSILVPGSVGATLIEDGAVTTPKLSATAIDGMTITGVTVQGGVLKLTNRETSFRSVDFYGAGTGSSAAEAVWVTHGPWDARTEPTAPNWAVSYTFPAGTDRGLGWTGAWPAVRLDVGDITVTARVRSSVTKSVILSFGDGSNTTALTANVWTDVSLTLSNQILIGPVSIYYSGATAAGATLEVSSLRIQASSSDGGQISISRDTDGNARFLVTAQDGVSEAISTDSRGTFVNGKLALGRYLQGSTSWMYLLEYLVAIAPGAEFWNTDDGRKYVWTGFIWQDLYQIVVTPRGSVSTSGVSIDPTSSNTKVPFGGASYQYDVQWSNAADTFTIQTSGWYRVSAYLTWNNSGSGNRLLQVEVNGAASQLAWNRAVQVTGNLRHEASGIGFFDAGDTVALLANRAAADTGARITAAQLSIESIGL